MIQNFTRVPVPARLLKVVAASTLTLLALSACGTGSPGEGKTFDKMRERSESSSYARNYDSLQKVFAMTEAGGQSAPASAVVRGRVVEVTPGVSMSWELTEDGEKRTDLPFDDPAAQINTYHLTVEVEETLIAAPSKNVDESVVVGIALPPGLKVEEVEEDYRSVNDAIFFLTDTNAVYSYDSDVVAIMENGSLMGFIVEEGLVEYPLMDEGDPLVADGRSVDALEAISSR